MKKISGFTLLELMVTLIISVILLMIASPVYESYEAHAERNHAEIALLRLSARLECYFDEHDSYRGATSKRLHIDNLTRGLDYQLSITSLSPAHFAIQATPLGAQATRDAECGILGLTDLNTKSISGNGDITACWQ